MVSAQKPNRKIGLFALWAAIERRISNQESAIGNASGSTATIAAAIAASIDQSGQLNMVSQSNTALASPSFANRSATCQHPANL